MRSPAIAEWSRGVGPKLAVMVLHDRFGMDPEMKLLTQKRCFILLVLPHNMALCTAAMIWYSSCATNITWHYVLLLWYETPSMAINFYLLRIKQVANGFFKKHIAYSKLTAMEVIGYVR